MFQEKEKCMREFKGFRHGINLGGWLSQIDERTQEHFDTFITEQDIADIKAMGLDHVRLPVDYDVIEDEKGNPLEAGLGYIDKCAAWCKKQGLHMIIDLHKAFGYTFDPLEKGADREIFFRDADLQDRFIRLWKRLADRYASCVDFIAFELLNEIISPNIYEEWNDLADRTIAAIHEIVPKAWVLVGGIHYNSAASVPLLHKPLDEYVVYNFHCYEPMLFTHQKAYWVENMPDDLEMDYPGDLEEYRRSAREILKNDGGAIASDALTKVDGQLFEVLFADAIRKAEECNAPLYCGEYGVIDRAPVEGTLRWLRDIHAVFEKYGIGRALWTYKSKDFGLIGEHYKDIRDEMIRCL